MKKSFFRKSNPPTFRRWNNKGYAVFNSLKREVRIGFLLANYLLFANPDSLSAQNQPDSLTKNYSLESIDVSAEQMPETYSSISRVVVSITQNEIERAAATSLNELLEYAANIDIRQRGVDGMQADVSVRGGSFDQVLILLNGVNISDPQTGHHHLNLPIELSSIERIEILKGPGAWKFGPGAFSGAINIITKTSDKTTIQAKVEAGEFYFNKESISANITTKTTSHLISINHSSTNGYINNTDNRLKNIFYQGKVNLKNNVIELQAGATDKGFGANSFYTPKYPDQYEELQTYFLSASSKTQTKLVQFEPKIYYRRNNDRFQLFRDNPSLSCNYHTSEVLGVNALANLIHQANAVSTLGFDFRNETIYSNNLGEISDEPIYSPVNDTILLTRSHSRSNYSVVISHKRYFKNLMVNIGVNFTHNTDLETKWFVYPGVDMNYQFNKSSSVFASVNKTMRMPTFTDLYYQGPANEGNPYLLPEEAIGYELGYKFQNRIIDLSLTGFSSKGENMIDWVRADANEKWHTINYTEINTTGAEFQFNTNLKNAMPNQSILNNLRLSYTFIDQDKIETKLISNYALNYLKHRFDCDFQLTIWKHLGAGIHVAYQDRNGEFLKYENTTSVGLVEYEPFVTTDCKLYWVNKGWNIYASINNIFNSEFFDYGNVPQPGRWIKCGIAKKIEFK